MTCVLCGQPVDLFELDAEGYGGLPAHRVCAEPMRELLAEVLDDAEQMIRGEADPRRHRRSAV